MKYVFVGDIHGKVECVEAALAKEGKKIFVGDFIDSFTRSVKDHKKCYDLVFDAIDRGEAESILGNHELSYIFSRHRCSGWNSKRDYLMKMYQKIILDKFKPFLLLNESFLVTHAGLTRQLWDRKKLVFKDLENVLINWWENLDSPAHWIGRYRGGPDDFGGIFWCDFNMEFTPIPGLKQVFGHTPVKSIRQIDQSFCIDCLDKEHNFLELEF